MIKFLEWDSSFFNKKIGIVEFDDYQESLGLNDFDLIYLKQDKDISFEIDNFINTHTETKIVFSKKINKSKCTSSDVFSLFETAYKKTELYELAFESGKYSRFNLDKNFSMDEFQSFYKKWIDNSLNKDFTNEILVYKYENSVKGFVTYKTSDNYATIGLFAVHSELQGNGIGRKLLEVVENNLYKSGISELRIPTQLQNEPACGFYTKSGYSILEKYIIKHYWKI